MRNEATRPQPPQIAQSPRGDEHGRQTEREAPKHSCAAARDGRTRRHGTHHPATSNSELVAGCEYTHSLPELDTPVVSELASA